MPFPVAPLAGAWIEISDIVTGHIVPYVAPLAGAWIEMQQKAREWYMRKSVAPLAGAWIEMVTMIRNYQNPYKSLPSRERGLKYVNK